MVWSVFLLVFHPASTAPGRCSRLSLLRAPAPAPTSAQWFSPHRPGNYEPSPGPVVAGAGENGTQVILPGAEDNLGRSDNCETAS